VTLLRTSCLVVLPPHMDPSYKELWGVKRPGASPIWGGTSAPLEWKFSTCKWIQAPLCNRLAIRLYGVVFVQLFLNLDKFHYF